MKHKPLNKTTGRYLIFTLASIGLFTSAVATARPLQSTLSNTPKPIKEATIQPKASSSSVTKNVVLARNTTSKAELISSTSTATPQKEQDKKTISRCWKRLMNMVREINHAHRSKTN